MSHNPLRIPGAIICYLIHRHEWHRIWFAKGGSCMECFICNRQWKKTGAR